MHNTTIITSIMPTSSDIDTSLLTITEKSKLTLKNINLIYKLTDQMNDICTVNHDDENNLKEY